MKELLIRKPALILIHGFRGAPIGLSAIADYLESAGFEVHVPEIPPCHASIPEFSPKSYADFIKNYITSNHLKRPILIGHSMGSLVASATAHFYPQLVSETLILLSPISQKPSKFFAFLSPLSAFLPRRLVDYTTTKFLFIPKDRDLFRRTLKLTASCSSANLPRRQVFQSAKFSCGHAISDFTLPQNTILIAGSQDRLIPSSATRAFAKAHHYRTIFLPGSGHLHNYEKPRETADSILSML